MIVATAGHIDHGKTLLVKALTGIDTDRLPEEKARGLTIDLGFAYLPLDAGPTIGFVDVPGHEHFVRNMVAGVTGIDHALLIVAADDGVMPQTVEHLAILDLLEVHAGTVAITKADKADAAGLAAVEAEVAALLAPTTLAGALVHVTSAATGRGIPELLSRLEAAARDHTAAAARGRFRLAIDRAFTIEGAGLVVTGAVHAGTVKRDDRLMLSPRGIPVRVRDLFADSARVEAAGVGHRCALNIVGAELGREAIRRGDWLVAPALHHPCARLDARVRLLPDAPRLRPGARLHLHLGTADVVARAAPLEGRAFEPGGSGLVQFALAAPIGALAGDRLILRDRAAARTLGGGVVLDPFAPARGRARPERLARLNSLGERDAAACLAALLDASPTGVDVARLEIARNLGAGELEAMLARQGAKRFGPLALAPGRWSALRGAVLEALTAHHRARPDEPGLAEAALRARLPTRPSAALLAAALDALQGEDAIDRRGGMAALRGHRARLGAADERLWRKARAVLEANRARPTSAGEIGRALGLDGKAADALLRRLARHGALVLIDRHRALLPDALAALAAIAERLASESPAGRFGAAAFRDASGIGRNQTIQVLEYFDTIRFTARTGDTRRVLRPFAAAAGSLQKA